MVALADRIEFDDELVFDGKDRVIIEICRYESWSVLFVCDVCLTFRLIVKDLGDQGRVTLCFNEVLQEQNQQLRKTDCAPHPGIHGYVLADKDACPSMSRAVQLDDRKEWGKVWASGRLCRSNRSRRFGSGRDSDTLASQGTERHTGRRADKQCNVSTLSWSTRASSALHHARCPQSRLSMACHRDHGCIRTSVCRVHLLLLV